MTDTTTSDNKKSLTVQGVSVDVRVPYAAGHTLNEAEASTLNQTFVENIRNNTAAKVKKALKAWLEAEPAEGEDPNTEDNFVPSDELLADIQAYADTYEFGIKRLSNLEPVDPVEKEARAIARVQLNAALKSKGIKVKDVPAEKYDAMLATLAAKDENVKEAQRRLKAAKSIGDAELDLSGLMSETESEPAAAE